MSDILASIELAHDCIAPGNYKTDDLLKAMLTVLEAADATAFGRQFGESDCTGPELLLAVKLR